MILFAVLILTWSFTRGMNEGIVMFFTAPRPHPWFGMYHAWRACEIGCLAGAAAVCPGWGAIAAVSVLAWEAFEVGYTVARRGQADGHENVLGILNLDGAGRVLALHMARLFVGAALITRGLT